MKSALIIFAILIIGIYISPLYKSKINIGNIFGILLGMVLLLLATFQNEIELFYKTQIGKIIIIVISTIAIVFFILFFTTLFRIIKASKYSAKSESTVIVLGCRVKGSVPSKALVKRCLAAKDYMTKNKNAVAILSGGQGADEDISEAECMEQILTSNGIEKERLIKEEKSTSTYENMLFSKQIVDELKLSNNTAIATSEYHMLRAKMYAQAIGFVPSLLPAKSIPILRVAYFTREVFGIWYMKIKEALQK
ncbi:YdcF family protein [Eubacterium sp.]